MKGLRGVKGADRGRLRAAGAENRPGQPALGPVGWVGKAGLENEFCQGFLWEWKGALEHEEHELLSVLASRETVHVVSTSSTSIMLQV